MKYFILLLCCISLFNAIIAQEETLEPSIQRQETLFGDWRGAKPWLKENGITIAPRITGFYHGMPYGDGITGFEIGGKLDAPVNIDLGKLGIWNNLQLITHFEYNFGNSANNRGGTSLPQNTALLFPGISGSNRFDISSVYFLKTIGKTSVLMLGKINMIDIAGGATFMGGTGLDAFQNIAFVAPPTGLVPPYIFGSILSSKGKHINHTFMIYDPIAATNRTGLENLFSKGIVFYGSVEKPVSILGKNGAHSIKAVFSTQDGDDFYDGGDIIIPIDLPTDFSSTKKYRYFIGYGFNQYIVQDQESDKGWGIFGQVGFSDANPTPVDWSMLMGLGGSSFFNKRSNDKWGLAYFQYSFSPGLNNVIPAEYKLRDEKGLEVFYNAALTPWLNFGLNYQIIRPTLTDRSLSHFFGLRSQILL